MDKLFSYFMKAVIYFVCGAFAATLLMLGFSDEIGELQIFFLISGAIFIFLFTQIEQWGSLIYSKLTENEDEPIIEQVLDALPFCIFASAPGGFALIFFFNLPIEYEFFISIFLRIWVWIYVLYLVMIMIPDMIIFYVCHVWLRLPYIESINKGEKSCR